MLRLGVIDLGTNSTRLLIADANEAGVHPLLKRAETTRLGLGLDKTGVICEESIEKTIEVIKNYKDTMKTYGVDESFAMGTSALRSCKNREEVLERIFNETGIEVVVLSGDQEARLGYLGVKTQYGDENPILVVDIGGGSTEFILCHQGEILYKKSIQTGCVRLTEQFIKSYPVANEAIEGMKTFIMEMLNKTLSEILDISKSFRVISIGGTATTLSAVLNGVERIENSSLTLNDIEGMVNDFKQRGIESMRSIESIEPGRHDIILAGALELLWILENLGADRTFITMRDGLEGIVLYRANVDYI